MSYQPPVYPHDRLAPFKEAAQRFDGGVVDLSVGTPFDAVSAEVMQALDAPDLTRGYQPSKGLLAVRQSCAAWLERRLGVVVDVDDIAATIGTKEFVVSTPAYLALRYPDRDTVLYPAVSYPSYAMGAELAGLQSFPVPVDGRGCLRLDQIPADVARRGLCLWSNSPSNPAGGVDDLEAIALWGAEHGVTVLSDECYVEFIWDDKETASGDSGSAGAGAGSGAARRLDRTILSYGTEGVLALHSLSKRSNFAGGRFGFFAGDSELVHYLSEIRKHAGMMVPGPVQNAARIAFSDDVHVDKQRELYWDRLNYLADVLCDMGLEVSLPEGGFYIWAKAPESDAWAFAKYLAEEAGVLCSPGDFYGETASGYVRFALVEPLERLALIRERLSI